jgi:CO/xanthine dehydrogenase Mo-binding subunit
MLWFDRREKAAAVDPEGVVWEDGRAKPASSNVGDFEPLSLREIAAKRAQTGGPIVAAAAVNPSAAAPGFATQFCDVEVDPETGKVGILRFVAAQDVGRAIHPSYVEGQIQGGVTQGIGWALNEEYIYDSRGHMENPGFLDYRIPVASDLQQSRGAAAEDCAAVEDTRGAAPTHPDGIVA